MEKQKKEGGRGEEEAVEREMDNELWEQLEMINGLSVKLGLERVSGQTEVYEKTLRLLIKEIEKCERNLKEFMGTEDMKNFGIEVHSMKSSLANLGVMELSAAARELELASGRGDKEYCANNLEKFLERLNELRSRLAAAFSAGKGEEKTGSGEIPEGLRDVLRRMSEACESVEFEEVNNELQNLETFRVNGDLGDRVEEIKDAVMVMEYDSAVGMIKKLIS